MTDEARSVDPRTISNGPRALERRALVWRAVVSAIFLSGYFMIVYNGCNWLAARRANVGTLYFQWERRIPFVPLAIFPYMSIDLFFFFSPLLCRDLPELRAYTRRIFLAMTLAAICFLFWPLQMGTGRPQVAGIEGMLFTLLAGFDKPYNLVPSLHIALLCILWVIYSRHTRGGARLIIQVWFGLIALSTLLTNQHHVMDLLTGYMLGVLCLYLVPDPPTDRDASQRMRGKERVGNSRVARHYLFGACLLAASAVALQPWGLLLLWPAFSGALVALAYYRVDVGIFRKTRGKLPWSSRFILAPYLLTAALIHARMKRRCDPYCQITPGVWVGGRLSRLQAKELAARVGAVLDLTAECSEAAALVRLQYKNIPLLDLTPPTLGEINDAVAFLRDHCHDGVYLHCALGVSRSVCVLTAFMLNQNREKSIDQAFALIQSHRSVARLQPPARKVLEAYRHTLVNDVVEM